MAVSPRNLTYAELHAPAGKFRLIRIDEVGMEHVEVDVDSVDAAKDHIKSVAYWDWQVRDDQARTVHTHTHSVTIAIF